MSVDIGESGMTAAVQAVLEWIQLAKYMDLSLDLLNSVMNPRDKWCDFLEWLSNRQLLKEDFAASSFIHNFRVKPRCVHKACRLTLILVRALEHYGQTSRLHVGNNNFHSCHWNLVSDIKGGT
jgi:hypothetical protein